MKSLKLLTAAVLLLVAGTVFAQSATPVVTERQENQKARIEQGAKLGLDGITADARQPATRAFEPALLRILVVNLSAVDLPDEDALAAGVRVADNQPLAGRRRLR